MNRNRIEDQVTTGQRISQSMLAYYRATSQMQLSAWREQQRQRAVLLGLLSAGAPIEPGSLSCQLETRDQPVYSRQNLLDALGQETFDTVLPELYRPVQYLSVRPVTRRSKQAISSAGPNPFV